MVRIFYNQLEISKACGIAPSTLSHHIGVGSIPEPTMRIGRRSFFSAEERDLILAYFEGRRRNQ